MGQNANISLQGSEFKRQFGIGLNGLMKTPQQVSNKWKSQRKLDYNNSSLRRCDDENIDPNWQNGILVAGPCWAAVRLQ